MTALSVAIIQTKPLHNSDEFFMHILIKNIIQHIDIT
jgi:hypothetical protein